MLADKHTYTHTNPDDYITRVKMLTSAKIGEQNGELVPADQGILTSLSLLSTQVYSPTTVEVVYSLILS